jgi:hypothetical protein
MTKRRVTPTGAVVRYDPDARRVVVSTANRAEFHLPIEVFKLPARATLEQLASVRLSPDQDGIGWDVFDVDYYWPLLTVFLRGLTPWQTPPASMPGGATPVPKTRPSRTVGIKGGRPRKRRAT